MADGALTKAEMAERLFEDLGLNKREAKELVEQFFEEIRLSLEQNEQVKLSGFGNFDLRDKKQRPGRNPKTGKEIPIQARIISVADVFDALSTKRPYKPAYPIDKCFEIMEEQRGKQFDPQVLDAFFACRDKIIQVQCALVDNT